MRRNRSGIIGHSASAIGVHIAEALRQKDFSQLTKPRQTAAPTSPFFAKDKWNGAEFDTGIGRMDSVPLPARRGLSPAAMTGEGLRKTQKVICCRYDNEGKPRKSMSFGYFIDQKNGTVQIQLTSGKVVYLFNSTRYTWEVFPVSTFIRFSRRPTERMV